MTTSTHSDDSSHFPVVIPPNPFDRACHVVRNLIQEIRSSYIVHPGFGKLCQVWTTLPVSNDEREALKKKLANAESSYIMGDKSAAVVALNQVLRQLSA